MYVCVWEPLEKLKFSAKYSVCAIFSASPCPRSVFLDVPQNLFIYLLFYETNNLRNYFSRVYQLQLIILKLLKRM